MRRRGRLAWTAVPAAFAEDDILETQLGIGILGAG